MVPFVFSILPCRKQQLVLNRCCCFHLSPLRILCSIPSYPSPFPSQRRSGGGGCNFAVKKRRPQFPSPLLSPQFVLSKLSCVFLCLPPRLGLFWEGRGEEGRKRRREDGAERKCLLCKRWSEKQNGKEKRATPSGGRASKRPNGS